MPTLFGNLTHTEVEIIRKRALREGERSAQDSAGRTADQVWQLWCFSELMRGNPPPLLCPKHIIRKVRDEINLKRAGL